MTDEMGSSVRGSASTKGVAEERGDVVRIHEHCVYMMTYETYPNTPGHTVDGGIFHRKHVPRSGTSPIIISDRERVGNAYEAVDSLASNEE